MAGTPHTNGYIPEVFDTDLPMTNNLVYTAYKLFKSGKFTKDEAMNILIYSLLKSNVCYQDMLINYQMFHSSPLVKIGEVK